MAKIEISVTRKGKGIDVQCRMIKDDSDSEQVKKAARVILVSLGGFIHQVLRKMFGTVKDLSTVPVKGNDSFH
ncbi:TPA: hypothetical protein ACMEVB_004185 [Klebsiella pneumoniae]|mgnify:FL=1|uniref:Uncharacterized protein n=1 Tax=Klebsiella michiganensis TaxID=1134687 RepID=A0A2J4RLB6_9ENTR|nr:MULTISPECIES: hypothetical protein [Klebsiella/Raoultella group]HDS9253950.1 hypothetical protein [Klebsiella pneumoniae subsp. pneumoniae]HDU4943204.1 hypothetical protein [Klebsiella pneumoniae subsp. ozaenae]ELI6779820.1 hypothetical protein [Klebsiella pneumoniae]KAB1784506.1 hypothetical protein FXO02_28020 [Klebsiella pneumoniae]MBD7647032.1 hypothetical protein [Klebsiella pneumoniae]